MTSLGGDWSIRIEPEAKAHIDRCGGAVTLRGSRRLGCCGGTAFAPTAEPSTPSDPSKYRVSQAGDTRVCVQTGLELKPGPIIIGLDALGSWKRLRVEGMDFQM